MQAYIGQVSVRDSPMSSLSAVVCFAGCDFGCSACSNAQFRSTKPDFLVDLKDVKRQVEECSGDIYFSGGEPCLQRQALLELARHARKLGRKVGMDFNGSKPECLASMLQEGLLDFVRMEMHAPLRDDHFERLTRSRTFFMNTANIIGSVKKSLEILRQHQDELRIEFVTTIVPGKLYRVEDIAEIAHELRFIKASWVLRPFISTPFVADKSLAGIEPPSESFLQGLRESVLKFYPSMDVRVEGYEAVPEEAAQ